MKETRVQVSKAMARLQDGFREPTRRQENEVSTNTMNRKVNKRPHTNMGKLTIWRRLVEITGLKYRWSDCHQVGVQGGARKTPPRGGEQRLWNFSLTHPDHDIRAFSNPDNPRGLFFSSVL